MINHFLNVFTFSYPSNPNTITMSSVIYHPPLLSFEIWTSIHTAIFILWLSCQNTHLLPCPLYCCPFDLQSLPSRLMLIRASLGASVQVSHNLYFRSGTQWLCPALMNHYHSSFISILVSAIVDYSYTLEYKLSRRQRCIPLLSHNLTLIGQDGHVCNPSRMQKQWVLSLALVIQQELNKNKRTQVLTMHVLNENIRNNHKAYVFERYQAAKDSNQGHWLLKG